MKIIYWKSIWFMYSETCVKQPLKKDKTKFLTTNGSLMKVWSIAECSLGALLEHSAIFLTYIKWYLVFKANFWSFWVVV